MAAGWEICIFDIGRSAYVHMHDCMHAYMYALRSMQLGKFVYIRDSTHDFHLQVCPRQTPTVCSDHASNSQSPGSAFSRGSVARAAGSERLGSGQPAASGQAAASGEQAAAARRGGARGQEGTHASAGPLAGAPLRHTLWSSVLLLRLAPSLPGPHGVSHHSRWLLRYMGEVTGGPARVTAQRRPHQSRREAGRVIDASGTAART